MKREHAEFVGNIPKHYDTGLGPEIFADYGQDLARRVAAAQPGSVVELAAGTGIVTRMLRLYLNYQYMNRKYTPFSINRQTNCVES